MGKRGQTGMHNNHTGGHNGGVAGQVLPSAQDLLADIKRWNENKKLVRENFQFKNGRLKKEDYIGKIAELKGLKANTRSVKSAIKAALELQAVEVNVL
jgi:hypothetical protein